MFDLNQLKLRPIYGSEFKPGATEEEIAELEKLFGHKLPETYKEILKKYNGSIPRLNFFKVRDETYTFHYFYSVDEEKDSTLNIWWNYKTFSSFTGPDTIPFADSGIDEIYFFKWVNDTAQIWILRYDELEVPEDDFVMDSFDNLLAALYAEE